MAVFSLGALPIAAPGGTISMTGRDGGGVIARLTGHDLLGSVGGLDGIEIDVRDAAAVPSTNLSFAGIIDVVGAATEAVAAGASGVVLSQGTDTLEETAFLVDSVWPRGISAARPVSRSWSPGRAYVGGAVRPAVRDRLGHRCRRLRGALRAGHRRRAVRPRSGDIEYGRCG